MATSGGVLSPSWNDLQCGAQMARTRFPCVYPKGTRFEAASRSEMVRKTALLSLRIKRRDASRSASVTAVSCHVLAILIARACRSDKQEDETNSPFGFFLSTAATKRTTAPIRWTRRPKNVLALR